MTGKSSSGREISVLKYIDEYRNPELVKAIITEIDREFSTETIQLMEVCGGHTITIYRYGIHKLLPTNLHLISGPGCPVCVTGVQYIDQAIAIARQENVIIASFGDMIRVPGSSSSLQKEKGAGADIRVCYSPMDAVRIAEKNPEKEVVFLGIGFETTAPTVAAAVGSAFEHKIENFSVLSAHKTMPQAMKALLDSGDVDLQGFICPGHVSAITGTHIYDFIARDYHIPCVVSGFEPVDMLQTILMILRQINSNRADVENQYSRSVRESGNPKALELMWEIFEEADAEWRGLGIIPGSGLKIREKYHDFDANYKFVVDVPPAWECAGCICGDIMRGVKVPTDCKLFKIVCNPQDPKGACMVSSEGTCATWYKYAESELEA